MSELDMWNILAAFISGNAVWFLAYVGATWLGFRMTTNICMNGGALIIGKGSARALFYPPQSWPR